MALVTMQGLSGEIRVAGRVAYRLGRWELQPEGGEDAPFRVSAEVAETDDYWAGQLEGNRADVVLDLVTRRWRWRDVDVTPGQPLSVRGRGHPEIL